MSIDESVGGIYFVIISQEQSFDQYFVEGIMLLSTV
jgi:hypothetical protein